MIEETASLEKLKALLEYLASQSIVMLWLAFILMLVAVSQLLSRGRNAPFSVRAAFVIALVLAFYGASTLAENLPWIASLVALMIVIGLPLALVLALVRR